MAVAGLRVAIVCVSPAEDGGVPSISYGAYHLQAALLASPRLPGIEVALIETPAADPDEIMARLEAFRPDLVGASAYVWSFPALAEVARRLRRTRPETLVVFGGPSARPGMFALPRFADARTAVDALVSEEGEEVMVELAEVARSGRQALAGVRGILVPDGDGWRPTAPRTDWVHPDALPSPYQLGLVPGGRKGRLESFRGCPVQCAFCQVPDSDGVSRVHSRAYLVRELRALRAARPDRVFLIDAAINLSPRAFRNLRDAEREVGLLREQPVYLNVFPSRLDADHLDFIQGLSSCWVSVGVQSLNPQVLARLHRPFDRRRFDRLLEALTGCHVSVDLILGLPFDDPASFLASLDQLLARGVSVQVSHCLALPDAFAPEAVPDARLRFDEETLMVTSCAGWSEAALRDTQAVLDRRVVEVGGRVERFCWDFFAGGAAASAAPSAPAAAASVAEAPSLPPAVVGAVARRVAAATGRQWRVVGAALGRGRLRVDVTTPTGPLALEAVAAQPGLPSYRVVASVAWSYWGAAARLPAAMRRQLDAVIAALQRVAPALLAGGSLEGLGGQVAGEDDDPQLAE